MTVFDLIILGGVVAAAVGGYRLGFLARAASWIGLGVGLYVAARFLPRIVNAVDVPDPSSRLLVAAVILIGGAFVGQAIGLVAGAQLHRVLPFGPVRMVDRAVGAVVGALGVIVALWLLLPSMADVPGWPARAARGSSLAQWVDRHFPQPPNTLEALRRLVGNNAFPQVFEALQPSQDTGPPPSDSGLAPAVLTRVSASTVKVEGEACNRIQDGSGFAVGPDLVVTNAHVVAGEPRGRTTVVLPGGTIMSATVVLFDPDRDLALLRVRSLPEAPLPVGAAKVGQTGAVFGHPGGEPKLIVAPAAIRQDVEAVGRDLYDTHQTRRDVFILASDLHPGDSGGALVDAAGNVVGVAFAIAPDRPGTSYALTWRELEADLAAPHATPVGTGSCVVE